MRHRRARPRWRRFRTWYGRWRRRHAQKSYHVLQRAEAALLANEYVQVKALLLPYLVKHPHDSEAQILLGRAALEQNSWEEALTLFSAVIKRKPHHPWAWALLGYTALRAGDYTLALSALQRARDQHPANITILESLLTISQRIDSAALRRSVERDLMKLDPERYKKKIKVQS
jgi:predicted Zn-dependent protease